jgi:hypothetical protein
VSADVVELSAYRTARLQGWPAGCRTEPDRGMRQPLVAIAHPGAVQLVIGSESGADSVEVWVTPAQAAELGADLTRLAAAADHEGRP